MPMIEPLPRQPQLDAIQALAFTEPVNARKLCLILLAETRQAFDARTFIIAALQLAQIEDQLGDFELAIQHLSEAMVFAEEFKFHDSLPEIVEQMGRCYYSQARYPQALEQWLLCIRLCGKRANLFNVRSLALMGLGQICDAAGDNQLAVQMHELAHGLLQDSKQYFLLIKAKINLAVNLKKVEQTDSAKVLLHESLTLCFEHQIPHYAATSLYRLAEIEFAAQRIDAAEQLVEQGLAIVATTPYHWTEVNLLSLWAEIQDQQQRKSALEIVQRAILIAQADGFRHLEMRLSEQAERYARAAGLIDLADDYLRKVNFLTLHLHTGLGPNMMPNLSSLSAFLLHDGIAG